MQLSGIGKYSLTLLTHTELIIYSVKRETVLVGKKIVILVLTYTTLNTHAISNPYSHRMII